MSSSPKIIILLLLFLLPANLLARKKQKEPMPLSVAELASTIPDEAPAFWPQGKEFVCLSGQTGIPLHAEEAGAVDSAFFAPGAIWKYDAMVSEEDWMGRQLLQLRFLAPDGTAYRFDTGRSMEFVTDTTYHPVLDGLYALDIVRNADETFRTRTLYININDDRIRYSASNLADTAFVPTKYIQVTIDSITPGEVTAPLKVWFSNPSCSGSFLTSLPESREALTSLPINRYLSVENFRFAHPDITDERWSMIQQSQFCIDMTMEEVRLSIGRPLRFERLTTRAGLMEVWFYPHSRVLEFLDGRLTRVGRDLYE